MKTIKIFPRDPGTPYNLSLLEKCSTVLQPSELMPLGCKLAGAGPEEGWDVFVAPCTISRDPLSDQHSHDFRARGFTARRKSMNVQVIFQL
jgi:hypothetical protein